jgi:hypothetical protein
VLALTMPLTTAISAAVHCRLARYRSYRRSAEHPAAADAAGIAGSGGGGEGSSKGASTPYAYRLAAAASDSAAAVAAAAGGPRICACGSVTAGPDGLISAAKPCGRAVGCKDCTTTVVG